MNTAAGPNFVGLEERQLLYCCREEQATLGAERRVLDRGSKIRRRTKGRSLAHQICMNIEALDLTDYLRIPPDPLERIYSVAIYFETPESTQWKFCLLLAKVRRETGEDNLVS
jgi:hypothetical protein